MKILEVDVVVNVRPVLAVHFEQLSPFDLIILVIGTSGRSIRREEPGLPLIKHCSPESVWLTSVYGPDGVWLHPTSKMTVNVREKRATFISERLTIHGVRFQ
jgi:hypothetical protein